MSTGEYFIIATIGTRGGKYYIRSRTKKGMNYTSHRSVAKTFVNETKATAFIEKYDSPLLNLNVVHINDAPEILVDK